MPVEYLIQNELRWIIAETKIIVVLLGKAIMVFETEASKTEHILPIFLASFRELLLFFVLIDFFLEPDHDFQIIQILYFLVLLIEDDDSGFLLDFVHKIHNFGIPILRFLLIHLHDFLFVPLNSLF